MIKMPKVAHSRRVDEVGREVEAKVDEAEQRDVEVRERAHDAVVDVVREFLEHRIGEALRACDSNLT